MNIRIALVGLSLILGCSSAAPPKGNGGEGGSDSAGSGGSDTGGSGGSGQSGSGGSSGRGGSSGSGGTSGSGGSSGSGGGDTGGSSGSGGSDTGGGSGTGGSGGSDTGGSGGSASPDGGAGSGGSGGAGTGGSAGSGGTMNMGNPFVYVGTGYTGSAIKIFQLDMATGALASKGMAAATSPTYMAYHPSRKHVYALSEQESGRVVSFDVDASSGALTKTSDVSSGGAGPAFISVSKSGKWLFVANYDSGTAVVLAIDAAGKVGAQVDSQKPAGNSTTHNVQQDPSGKWVAVCNVMADKVFIYALNDSTGKLTMVGSGSGMGQGPRHVVFSADGTHAYAIGETVPGIVSFNFDAATGALSAPMVSPIGGGQGAHVALHPSGKFLWGSARAGNTLAGFTIGADGRPKPLEKITAGLASPWDFAVDATGQYLLVANDGGGVKVFKIDQATGKLTAVGNGVSGGGPHYVGVFYP